VIDDLALESDGGTTEFIWATMVGSRAPVEGAVLGKMNAGFGSGTNRGGIAIRFSVPENIPIVRDGKMDIGTITDKVFDQSGGYIRETAGLHAEALGPRAHQWRNSRNFRCNKKYSWPRGKPFRFFTKRNDRSQWGKILQIPEPGMRDHGFASPVCIFNVRSPVLERESMGSAFSDFAATMASNSNSRVVRKRIQRIPL
jgi:hypothetical protein